MQDRTDQGATGLDHAPEFADMRADMRAAIRAYDWSQTPLGPIETWPNSLAVAVDIMLASPARIVLYWGPEHIMLYNDRARELLGNKHPAALGRPAREVFPEIWNELRPMFAAVLAGGDAVESHEHLLPLDRCGRVQDAWFDYTLSAIPGEDGSALGLCNIAVEVTDKVFARAQLRRANETLQRKVEERTEHLLRSEQDLRNSEESLRRILNRLPVGVAVTDSHGQLLSLNPAALRLHGFVPPEDGRLNLAKYRDTFDLRYSDGSELPPDRWPLARAVHGDYMLDCEVLLRRRDRDHDEGRILSCSTVPVAAGPGGTRRVVFVMHDVTEQRRFHNALADNEARLRAIFETVADAIVTIDDQGVIESVNPAVMRMFNYTADELIGQNVRILMPDPERSSHDDYLERYRRTGERRIIGASREMLGCRKDGTMFSIELSVTELCVAGKRMFTGVMRDITIRKQAEQAVLESRRQLELVADNVPAMISYIDRDQVYQFNNARYEEWFGLASTSISGKTVREVLGEAAYESRAPYIERVLRGEMVRFEGLTHHREFGRRDTQLAYVPDIGEGGQVRGFYALIFDITERKRAERALRESEEKFRTAFQIAPIVLVVNALEDGRYLEINDTFEQLLGYTREEMVGRSIRDLEIWPEPQLQDQLAERLRTQDHFADAEVTLRAKNGELKTVLASANKINVDGIACVLSSWIDITGRKRTTEQLRHTHDLIEGVTQGTEDLIAAVDGEFRLLFFNRALGREVKLLWGQDLALGMNLVEVVVPWPDQQHKSRDQWTRALAGESFIATEEFGPSKRKQTYELRYNPLRDAQSEITGAACIIRNVTEQVRMQQALRVANEQLQEISRRKDDYFAMLGHELRNPLAAICSATELVKLSTVQDPSVQRAITVLERQSSHMVRLIDGLLEVSRIARGKIDLELDTLDLREVLERVLDDRRDQIEARGLSLVTELAPEPAWILGDQVRLTQVFDNLIGNALKFTDPPGIVTVTLDHDDDCVVVRVQDTGIGIRPEVIAAMFEPFQQESQPIARMAGGLGLGLALAKGLVELHGGTIEAHSAGLGTGTEFVVRLRLSAAPAQIQPVEPSAEAEPRRILIVEDNRDAAEMLRAVLELFGHEVTVVDNGERALKLIRSRPFDLVLCDLGLPGMSGYELARQLRADEPLRRLPLVALSGYGQTEDRKRTTEVGFDEHLVKPVTIAILEQTLRKFPPRS